mgnify:CR=1 FL=1|jgi:cytochrome c biogenesis protein CcdA|tara:strand:- start:247 stop:945 length:699 start_codon:yes stop_codon:yes gene_type:complete
MMEFSSVILIFLAGLSTIATPCIIPILPPMLAGSVGHRLRPIFIVAGSAITFTLMGGIFSVIGPTLGVTKDTLRFIFIGVIILLGIIMLYENINNYYAKYSSMLINRLGLSRFYDKTESLPSAFMLGMALGIIWIPCVGPILGGVLTYVAYQGELIKGSFLLLIYSAGLGLPMLMIAYGGKYFGTKIEWTRRNSQIIRKFAGFVLILTGIVILIGLDRYIQSKLLPFFPPLL